MSKPVCVLDADVHDRACALVRFHLGGLYISFSFVASDRGQIVVNSIYSGMTRMSVCECVRARARALNASCADKCCCNSIAPHKGYNPHRHYHIYTAQENRLLPCVRLCLCTCVYHKLPVFVYKCNSF